MNMNLFETVLEIKTGKKDLPMKAVYISDKDTGRYYIYYYDVNKHAFYINDLEWTKSSKTILEQIINKAYKQEMSGFVDLLRRIQSRTMPKVICFSLQEDLWMLEIEKVKMKAVMGSRDEIIGFELAR